MDERRIHADRLFDAALDLAPAERAAYLERACAGDGELRALVDRLLAAAEIEETQLMPGGGMQGPLWDGLMADLEGGESEPVKDETTPIGTVIGRYRLVREIGRGGMAVVYLAERADGQFQHQVALKRIQPGFDTDEVIQRFDQERQILALTHHPNIAQLLDGGVGPRGRPYFVMEYVEGRPIERYCDEERLSVPERLDLFLQVARAVDYAHRNLVVHRDLKPSNILVDADGHAKLLDFGIAKLLDAEATPGATPVTRTHGLLMTPVYASPEQVRGQPVTTASDIYQLGLLLYQLLTGRWPYHLSEHQPIAVVRAICEDDPTRPSTALASRDAPPSEEEPPTVEAIGAARRTSASRLKRQLAGDLDNIALMALRKEPERRYGAVAQLIDDVESYLAGKPISARSDSFLYRAGKLVRRHKAAFTTAAAAVALLVALAVFYTVQLATERDRARLAAAEAGRISDFLSSLFEVSVPTRSKGEAVTARQLLDRGAVRIEDELAGQPRLRAAMMTRMGNVYRELALYEEARPLLEHAVALRRGEPGPQQLELAESLHGLARLREEEGEHAVAQALYEEVLAIREAALEDRPESRAGSWVSGPSSGEDGLGQEIEPQDRFSGAAEVAHALAGLGRVLELQGAYEQARRYHERALGIFEIAYGLDHPEVGRSLLGLGTVAKRTREFEEAKELLSRALFIFERHYEDDHPHVADTRVSLAGVLRFTGDPEGARAQYEQALPLLERAYGADHPQVAAALDSLARLHNAMKDREAAIAYHRRALAIREAAFGADHILVAASLNNLGSTHWSNQDLELAQSFFERSAATFEANLGPDHVDVSRPLNNLAQMRQDSGDLAGAAVLFERVLEIRERSLGPEHSMLNRPLYNLGRVRMRQETPEAAEPLLRRALAVGRDHEPYRHPEIIWPRIYLGRCLTMLERFPEAEEVLLENLAEDGIDRRSRQRSHEFLMALYEAWSKPQEAAVQRQALAALESEV